MKFAASTLALLLLPLLAGCAQPPAEPEPEPQEWGPAVAWGDCVTATWEARHPETGYLLGNGTTFFTVGLNFSNLGSDVEGAIVGHHVNETFDVVGSNETGRIRTEEHRMQRVFGPFDIEQWWTRDFFLENNPAFDLDQAEGGEYIHVHPSYDGAYREHNETHVLIAFTPTPDQMRKPLRNLYGDPYPIELWFVPDEQNGTWEEWYVPTTPDWFEIEAAPPYSCWTDFLLPPGKYRVLAADNKDLVLEAHPTHNLPGELRFTVTIDTKHDLFM